MVKPDVEIFTHIVEDLACQPSDVLYFDDNQLNVDAALECGLDAALARHPGDCRAALVERGVLR